ncbi:hypothetical protein CBL_11445 [Carabus blaptoides fortunei]
MFPQELTLRLVELIRNSRVLWKRSSHEILDLHVNPGLCIAAPVTGLAPRNEGRGMCIQRLPINFQQSQAYQCRPIICIKLIIYSLYLGRDSKPDSLSITTTETFVLMILERKLKVKRSMSCPWTIK